MFSRAFYQNTRTLNCNNCAYRPVKHKSANLPIPATALQYQNTQSQVSDLRTRRARALMLSYCMEHRRGGLELDGRYCIEFSLFIMYVQQSKRITPGRSRQMATNLHVHIKYKYYMFSLSITDIVL